MTETSKYQLFIRSTCSSCDKILSHLKAKKIAIHIVNIDSDEYDLPFRPMIFPALVKEKRLLGYGFDDIISHLIR